MHKNNQNFIIIKSFFSWFTLISKNAFILGGSVLYFAYSTFRSIDISTLSIQYSLEFLTFYPQEIMVLACKKYPIRNVYNYALQSLLVPHIANMCISTCVSAHVYQHMCISICVAVYTTTQMWHIYQQNIHWQIDLWFTLVDHSWNGNKKLQEYK